MSKTTATTRQSGEPNFATCGLDERIAAVMYREYLDLVAYESLVLHVFAEALTMPEAERRLQQLGKFDEALSLIAPLEKTKFQLPDGFWDNSGKWKRVRPESDEALACKRVMVDQIVLGLVNVVYGDRELENIYVGRGLHRRINAVMMTTLFNQRDASGVYRDAIGAAQLVPKATAKA